MKDLRYFDPHRRATWLELFFDLIIVVALRDAGEILSETHDGHIAPQQFLHFVLVFLPLWWIWAGHTIYANRFDTDSRQHRLSTLLIMFLLIVISAQIVQDHYDYALAVACYCGARLIIAVMYFVSKRKHHDRGGFATQVGTVFAVGAAISLSSILLERPWNYLVFYAGIVFDMVALVLLKRRLHVVPAHTPHMVERIGLLTIIMLGESVISISAALTDIAWNQSNIIAAVSGFRYGVGDLVDLLRQLPPAGTSEVNDRTLDPLLALLPVRRTGDPGLVDPACDPRRPRPGRLP
jgi:low temperature requirement protein LtrA